MSELEATIERLGMKDLFERADRDGLWFWCGYQDLWFTPDALRREMSGGRFRWGAVNWELRDPKGKLAALEAEENRARTDRKAIERELATRAPAGTAKRTER